MNNAMRSCENKFDRAAKLAAIFLAAALWAGIAGISACAQSQSAPAQKPAAPAANQTQAPPAQPGTQPQATTPAGQAAARAAAEAAAAKLKAPPAADQGDFYIVSSISIQQKQIVLKLPTEVTLLVGTNAQTQFLDEQSKPLTLKDLRAGDTVYVVLAKGTPAGGTPVVQKLQRGGMTVQELQKKYLSGGS